MAVNLANINREETLAKLQKLKVLFESGEIQRPIEHEVNPGLPIGSRENFLYFTLPVTINFQRNSPAMWKSALATYQDPETNYLFFPERLVEKAREEVQRDLTKHKLALQRNKHTDIWIKISETLHNHYQSDPRYLLQSKVNDVVEVLKLLRIEKKKDFPYLSGIKLANYWLFILSKFTDVKLSNMSQLSIIPDTHITKTTTKLGLVNEPTTSIEVDAVWKEFLLNSALSPVDLHSVFWHWSRAGFIPEV